MKKITFCFLMFCIVVTLIFACQNDDSTSNNTPLITQGAHEFTGNAVMNIEYWDYDIYSGQDFFVEKKTYTYEVYIYAKPALVVEGVEESNPFNLQIYPDREHGGDEEGHIDVSSCIIINDPLIGQVILQFWNISLEAENLSGSLTDTHLAESAAANQIWCYDNIAGVEMTMPFYMAQGSIINGTINDTKISLTISGESTNSYRKFTCQIEATTP